MATESVGGISYVVEADTSKLLSSTTDVDSSLSRLNRTFKTTDKAANDTEFRLTKTAAAVKSMGNNTDRATASLSAMTKIMGGMLGLGGVGAIIAMADSYNEYAERISMATSSMEEYELVQRRLLETANGTYRAMSEAQEVYIQTADSLRSLGYSTDQVLDITDSLSYSFVKNATSGQRAQSAMDAFTKSINRGKVDSQGWQTILAAIPTVVNDIAAATGKTSAEIRAMGFAGELAAKDLNEGLRQSLEGNKKAADDMATTVSDAFTALKNGLAAYVGEANRAHGATNILSGAIVTVAENIETVVNLLVAAGAGALAKYIAQMGASTVATMRQAVAARAQAAEELNLARANAAQAAAAAGAASANAGLTTSHTAAARAADAQAAAATRLAAATTAARTAGVGLLAILGGPVGIIGLVATAAAGVALFGSKSKQAASDVDVLTLSVKELSAAQMRQARVQATEKIEELGEAAQKTARRWATLTNNINKQPNNPNNEKWRRELVDLSVEMETLGGSMTKHKQKINEIDSAQSDLNKTQQIGTANLKQADPEVQKKLKALEQERDLARQVGVERAKLQAIQQLGENATPEERAEAERLVTEIYRLEEARKKVTGATRAQTKSEREAEKALEKSKQQAQDNVDALADMARELLNAGMGARELYVANSLLKLNPSATPDQVKTMQDLAEATWAAMEAQQKRAEFGSDPRKAILGDSDPLSGGAFDDQFARYQAEAELEEKRYAEQLARLQEAKSLQIEVLGGYQKLEAEMAQAHADRMAQIEQAKYQNIMKAGEAGFASVAEIMRNAQGEQSGIYKAMFAASKAFAIAQSVVAIQQGIAQAAALPFPANLAAMATVAAQTASIISNIQSVSYGGGRQYGGPVDASKMYRVNEGGAPEILNTSSGKQFLLPNSRGEVVSNKNATGGSSGIAPPITVILNESQERAGQVQQSAGADDERIIQVWVADIRGGGKASRALESTYGFRRQGT